MSAARPLGVIFGALLDAGSALLKSNAKELIELGGFSAEDFAHEPTARMIFQTIANMAARGSPITAQTVFYAAKAAGPISADALDWLEQSQAGNTLDREKFKQVAESYRVFVRNRMAAAHLGKLKEALEQGTRSVANIALDLDSLSQQLQADYEPDHFGDEDVQELMVEWGLAGQPGAKPMMLPTYVKELDALITGLQRDKLHMIIGDPSTGKSALAGTLLDLQLENDHRPGLFGLEDRTVWFPKRVMARELNMRVRDVGAKVRTPEEEEASWAVSERLKERNRRLVTYKRRRIGLANLLRRAARWVTQHGCTSIWIDNLKMVQHRPSIAKRNEGVSDILDNLAIFAERYQTPVILLAHTTRPEDKQYRTAPPTYFEIAECSDAERFAYGIFGLWRKSRDAARFTVLKYKEAKADETIELNWLGESALLDAEAKKINIAQERREEAEARSMAKKAREKAEREERWRETQERKARLIAEKEAAKAKAAAEAEAKKKAEEPQLPLIGVEKKP